MADRTDPYLNFKFRVEIDAIIVAGFTDVSGLEAEMKPEEYEEGGVNTHPHRLPGRFEYPNVVLTRGLTDYAGFWSWIERVRSESVDRKHVSIYLLDADGTQRWGWEARNAYPVTWRGPEFRADDGAVAMETVELAHEGLTKMAGFPR